MILSTLESKVNLFEISNRHVHSARMYGALRQSLSFQINARGVFEILKTLEEAFIEGRCLKKAAPRKVLDFSISRECKINL